MTTAEPYLWSSEDQEPDRHWLNPYLRLQQKADARIRAEMKEALRKAETDLSKIENDKRPGAVVRTAQLQSSLIKLKSIIKATFLNVGDIVREEQGNAARLAENMMIQDESGLWKMILPGAEDRKDTWDTMLATAERNIQAVMTRVLVTEQPLSKRVYKSEALATKQVDKVVNRNIAIGASAADLARDVRDLISPNTPGGVSYRAKTLARTEINNAFHAQSINDMQNRPWIQQAQWNLSKSHGEQGCVCESYARTRLFPVDRVPKKPHPGCLCTVTPDMPDLETALKDFMSGQYSPWLPSVVG